MPISHGLDLTPLQYPNASDMVDTMSDLNSCQGTGTRVQGAGIHLMYYGIMKAAAKANLSFTLGSLLLQLVLQQPQAWLKQLLAAWLSP